MITVEQCAIIIVLFIVIAPPIVGAGLSKYRISTFPPTQCVKLWSISPLFINPSGHGCCVYWCDFHVTVIIQITCGKFDDVTILI